MSFWSFGLQTIINLVMVLGFMVKVTWSLYDKYWSSIGSRLCHQRIWGDSRAFRCLPSCERDFIIAVEGVRWDFHRQNILTTQKDIRTTLELLTDVYVVQLTCVKHNFCKFDMKIHYVLCRYQPRELEIDSRTGMKNYIANGRVLYCAM